METGARGHEAEQNRERAEELARLGRALPTETLAQLSSLTRSLPPETFSSWVGVLQSLPKDYSNIYMPNVPSPGLELSVLRRSARALHAAVQGLGPEELTKLALRGD